MSCRVLRTKRFCPGTVQSAGACARAAGAGSTATRVRNRTRRWRRPRATPRLMRAMLPPRIAADAPLSGLLGLGQGRRRDPDQRLLDLLLEVLGVALAQLLADVAE